MPKSIIELHVHTNHVGGIGLIQSNSLNSATAGVCERKCIQKNSECVLCRNNFQ